MGYSRIISWVESNFNPRNYNSYFEFEQAVKNRFNSDGIDLPKGAESEMMDYFEGYFTKQDQTIIPTTSLDRYTPPEPEILQINPDFFTPSQSSEDLPEILQPLPQEPVTSPGRLGNIGKSIGGFFRRLFRF